MNDSEEVSLFKKDWEKLEELLCFLKIPYEVGFSCHMDPNEENTDIYSKHIKIASCKVSFGKFPRKY